MKSNVTIWPLIILISSIFCICLPIAYYSLPEAYRQVNPVAALWFTASGWGLVFMYSIYKTFMEGKHNTKEEVNNGTKQ